MQQGRRAGEKGEGRQVEILTMFVNKPLVIYHINVLCHVLLVTTSMGYVEQLTVQYYISSSAIWPRVHVYVCVSGSGATERYKLR